MKQLLVVLASIFLISCAGGNKATDQHIYWVNSTKVSCVGVAPMKCLQVQKAETMDPAAWENFFAPIDGFDYQPGYIYKIRVKETRLDPADVPADASSIKYKLVEVLEKKQDMKMRINDIWVAETIDGESLGSLADGLTHPRLEIHVGDMRYMGTDGCNHFNGGIIELDEQSVRFGVAAGTRRMCMDMKIPDLFNTTLPEVTSWEIKENHLHLFDADGIELMCFQKTD